MGTELEPEKWENLHIFIRPSAQEYFVEKDRILLRRRLGKCPLKKSKTDCKTKFISERWIEEGSWNGDRGAGGE